MSGYSRDELRGRRPRQLLFGPATSDETLARIRRTFEQEEAGAATRDNGIGLGLTITKRLVDLMGGGIQIESAKGEGTTVTVALPRDDDPWGEDAS